MANEKRLIDANKLMEHLENCIATTKGLFRSVCVAIKCYVEQMPTVDAVEVVHGRWIHRPDKRICPLCNYRYSYFGGKDYNYCPNCGAKMEGR